MTLAALLVAGCAASGSGTTDAATSIPPVPGRPPATVPPAPAGIPMAPYFLRNGVVGSGEQQRLPDGADAPQAALDRLLAGPSDVDKRAGLTTAVPPGTTVRSLHVADGTATVDFTRPIETADTRPQVAQVVYTLTQFPSITKVRFLVDGLDNGATGVLPVGRADVARFTPDVLLTSPWPGKTAATSLKVSGDLDPATPSFGYQLLAADGSDLGSGTITATLGDEPRRRFDQAITVPAGATGAVRFVVVPPPGSRMSGFEVPVTLT